jgi:aminopeptidase
MVDPRTIKLADILVNYAIKVKPGDWVVVSGDVNALPLIDEVVEKIVIAGGNPNILTTYDRIQETQFRNATEDQLKWISPLTRMIYEKADVVIKLRAPSNTRTLSGIDPKKQQISTAAKREITKILFERSASKDLRWTFTMYPCPASAQEADMSLRDYEDFVYKATFN